MIHPFPLEYRTSGRLRSLLVHCAPVVDADRCPYLGQFCQRVFVHPEGFPFLPGVPAVAVCFCDCRKQKHLPLICVGVLLCQFQEPPSEVIFVPAGQGYQDGALLLLPGVKRRGVPLPQLLAVCAAVGFLSILDGVIYDDVIAAHARNAAANASPAVAAPVSHYLEDVRIAQGVSRYGTDVLSEQPRFREQFDVGLSVHYSLNIPVHPLRQVCGVGCADYVCVRVSPEDKRRKFAAHQFAFPVAGRHKNHKPPQFFFCESVQVFAQKSVVPVHLIPFIGVQAKLGD